MSEAKKYDGEMSEKSFSSTKQEFVPPWKTLAKIASTLKETRESLLNAMTNLRTKTMRKKESRNTSVTTCTTKHTATTIYSQNTSPPRSREKSDVSPSKKIREITLEEANEKIIKEVCENVEIITEKMEIMSCSSKGTDQLSSTLKRQKNRKDTLKRKVSRRNSEKFVSLAEAVLRYQTRTPQRFRTCPATKATDVNDRTRLNKNRAGPSTQKLTGKTAVEPSSRSTLVPKDKNQSRFASANGKHSLPRSRNGPSVIVRKSSAFGEKTMSARGLRSRASSTLSLSRSRQKASPAPAVPDRDDARPEPTERSKFKAETSTSRSNRGDSKARSGTHRKFQAGIHARDKEVIYRRQIDEFERRKYEKVEDPGMRPRGVSKPLKPRRALTIPASPVWAENKKIVE